MRTDTHSPKNMIVTDYEDVGYIYQGPLDMYIAVQIGMGMELPARAYNYQPLSELVHLQTWGLTKRLREHGWRGGHYSESNRCDHCGAIFYYGIALLHEPTDEIIVVGHQCADAIEGAQIEAAEKGIKDAKRTLAKVRKYRKIREAADTFLCERELLEVFEAPHRIIADIWHKLYRYGSLSEKQVGFVKRLAAEALEQTKGPLPPTEAEREKHPVIEGRIEIVGQIISTKTVTTYYGRTLKMLVEDDRGFRVWGTYPTGLMLKADGTRTLGEEPGRGDRIAFTATVERSKDDVEFGFFKRPTKANLITETEAA